MSNIDIAVLSDIHSNYVALNRCLEYAFTKQIKKFIFLGDYVGELASPEKTLQILYEMKKQYDCIFLRGNLSS